MIDLGERIYKSRLETRTMTLEAEAWWYIAESNGFNKRHTFDIISYKIKPIITSTNLGIDVITLELKYKEYLQ